jgi:hypothetical protein
VNACGRAASGYGERVEPERAESLSIGSVVGGATPSTRRWSDAISSLTREVIDARAGVETPLNVNVVFHVPGNILKPDYEGERTGRFSKRLALLMVQVALPEEPPDDIAAYLRVRLAAAVGEAEQWAAKRRIASDLRSLRAVVASL